MRLIPEKLITQKNLYRMYAPIIVLREEYEKDKFWLNQYFLIKKLKQIKNNLFMLILVIYFYV